MNLEDWVVNYIDRVCANYYNKYPEETVVVKSTVGICKIWFIALQQIWHCYLSNGFVIVKKEILCKKLKLFIKL